MDKILNGLLCVICYLDDILVTGKSTEEHNANLEKVLTKLQESGKRLKISKCKFLTTQTEYVGHCIDAERLHPSPSKISAIMNVPRPSNVNELRFFLGMIH